VANWEQITRQTARKYGLDPNIFAAQIKQESGFNPGARSPAGALGIAQIMPGTARSWNVDPGNPRAALNAAAAHMASYVKQFGNYADALRAYNAGPGAVQASHGYAETNNYVRTILGSAGTSGGTSSGTSSAPRSSRSPSDGSTTTTTTTPGVDNRVARFNLVQSFLNTQGADPLDFATQFKALADVPGTTTTTTTPGSSVKATGSSTGLAGDALAAFAKQRADVINSQHLAYQWGGGHAGKTKLKDPIPLDCSGAVSKVLGIDPRVSGQFETWGKPGDGGDKGVTIAASPTHVLMKINGHWFGTSASNPKGGAGWIPAGWITPGYLKGFTLRHE
jgi:hypothetical protein